MNFLSSITTPLYYLNLKEEIALTNKEKVVALIALAILAGSMISYLVVKCATLSPKVTVIEADENKHSSRLDKVNGNVKVVFDSWFGSGATMEGEFTDGEMNGEGKITYPDSGWFALDVKEQKGKFKNGYLQGEGKITYRNGMIVEGQIKSDAYSLDTLNGEGKITYPDGEIKEGQFDHNTLHGHGKITRPNGEIEEGQFKNGILE